MLIFIIANKRSNFDRLSARRLFRIPVCYIFDFIFFISASLDSPSSRGRFPSNSNAPTRVHSDMLVYSNVATPSLSPAIPIGPGPAGQPHPRAKTQRMKQRERRGTRRPRARRAVRGPQHLKLISRHALGYGRGWRSRESRGVHGPRRAISVSSTLLEGCGSATP